MDTFQKTFGCETLEAEQTLAGTQAFHLDNGLQKWLRRFSSRHTQYGNLEPEYRPGRIFEVPTVLTPEVRTVGESPERFREGGATRVFVHPAEWPRLARPLAGCPRDSVVWRATPASSSRTLFVVDPRDGEGFFLKLSLSRTLFGFPRAIHPDHAVRAVVVTELVRAARPDCFLWPESFACLGPGDANGWILRTLPQGTSFRDDIFLPYYALLSSRPGGRWVDLLVEASGQSRERFVRETLVLPVVKLYGDLALDHGIPTELHKQNVGLVVDRKSLRVRGLYLRDMDGLTTDLPYRRWLGLSDPEVPKWAPPDVLKAKEAQLAQAFYFLYLGAMNLDQIALGTLPGRAARRLLREADRRYLDRVGARFGEKLHTVAQLPKFWDRFHSRLPGNRAWAAVSSRERRGVRLYGWYRVLEAFFGSLVGIVSSLR